MIIVECMIAVSIKIVIFSRRRKKGRPQEERKIIVCFEN